MLTFGPEKFDVALYGFAPIYVPFVIDGRGIVQGNSDIKVNLLDSKGSIKVPKGLKMLNANEHPLLSLSYQTADILPAPPANQIILQGYDFSPQYSTFSPNVGVILKFDVGSLPAGTKSGDIQMASWDGNQWAIISGTSVNMDAGEISGNVTHFSDLAIFCKKPAPANVLSVSNLTIFPRYSSIGELVRIQVTAKNSGPTPENYELVLKLNDEIEETRYLAIESKAEYTETFEVNDKKPGYYTVTLNGLKDYFAVEAETQATASSKPTTPTDVLPPSNTYNVEIPEQGFIPSSPNTKLIIIIASCAAGILVISLAIFFIVKK